MPRGILFFCAVFGLTALVSFAGVAMRTAAATSAVARNAFAPDLFYYKISYYAYNGEPDDNYRRNFKRTHTMPQSIGFLCVNHTDFSLFYALFLRSLGNFIIL